MYLLWEDRHYAKSTRIDWHLNTNQHALTRRMARSSAHWSCQRMLSIQRRKPQSKSILIAWHPSIYSHYYLQVDHQTSRAFEGLEHILTVRERIPNEQHPDWLVSQHEHIIARRVHRIHEAVQKAVAFASLMMSIACAMAVMRSNKELLCSESGFECWFRTQF